MNPDGPLARTTRRVLLAGLRLPGRWAGLRLIGAERLPAAGGPLILACNHAAFADTFWLHLALPRPPAVCGAKPRLFRSAPLRALMGLADIRRIDGEAGFYATAGALLDVGRVVLVYPEMGRNPAGLGTLQPWAAALALDRGVGILPLWLWGTTDGDRGGPVVVVGRLREPLGDAQALTDQLRQDLLDLRAQAEAVCC